jgi:glycogen operon protein
VNFVTAHDGFTLADVVSYAEKHNEANGEGNADGTSHNWSWNCGVEGPTTDPAVIELRCRQQRNLLATLLLSQGTPMLLAGDEQGRTQKGNNNAYCQDNEISWIDWRLDARARQLGAFARKLVRLRAEHPILRRGRFFTGAFNEAVGVKDVTWVAPSGGEMSMDDWHNPGTRCFGMLMDGRAQATGIRVAAADTTLLMILNAHNEPVAFTLPDCAGGQAWSLVFDTFDADHAEARLACGDRYAMRPQSFSLFLLLQI